MAAVLTKGIDVTEAAHLGRKFTAQQRTAMPWRDPTRSRRGRDDTLRLEYDDFEDSATT